MAMRRGSIQATSGALVMPASCIAAFSSSEAANSLAASTSVTGSQTVTMLGSSSPRLRWWPLTLAALRACWWASNAPFHAS